MITVFTPTYNRAYTLSTLYNSLLQQTNKNFEWLIVDDGSSDETREIVRNWEMEGKVKIRYIFKKNEGLNSAYNLAVAISLNEIFFRVDSDDYLKMNAIQLIYDTWYLVENDKDICGIVFLAIFDNGNIVGTHPFNKVFRTNFFDYRYKYKATGDRAEVMKTEVLKKYPFPIILGEKFLPEGFMWNRIAYDYDALYMNIPIYIREYREDSITTKIVQTLKKNNKGATLYYTELLKHRQPFYFFFKHSLLYWRYAFYTKKSLPDKIKDVGVFVFVIGYIPSLCLIILDKLTGKTI